MPVAVFKDLCLDTTRPEEVGPYWRDLLQRRGERQPGGDWALRGERPEETLWVNTVPEAKTVKSRVHLDVRVADHAGPARWEVRQDPDGLEWCAFAPRGGTGVYELCVDAVEARSIAEWWADCTGASVHNDGHDWWWLEGAAGFPYDYWVFNPVPEPKTAKNRMHWDVVAEPGALVAAGARLLAELPSWTVLADPEGNEFCAFTPGSAG